MQIVAKNLYYMRLTTIFFSITLLLFSSVPASALSQEDIESINRDSVQYKKDFINPSSCSVSSVPVLSGGDPATRVVNYLLNRGLNEEQAIGVVANLKAESGIMPNRKQGNGIQTITSFKQITSGTGYGIAQWTTAGRQKEWIKAGVISAGVSYKDDYSRYTTQEVQKINGKVLSLELQLKYLYDELENNPGYGLTELKNATDVKQATWIFMAFFERPGVVVDAGLAGNPNQPDSGPAKTELDERVAGAAGVTGDGSGTACGSITSALTGGTGTPSFDAIPSITVDGSPPGPHKESNCTGTFTPGALSLQKLVEETWIPPVTSVGGYSCRSIVGGSETSIHGVGRAIDIMIDSTTTKGRETGDQIRNFMINNAVALGVQRVIWMQHTWSADQNGWRDYTGENPHTDHLHIEINLAASKNPNLANGGSE